MAPGGENSLIIDGIVKNDKVSWHRKKNLRNLYLWLVPFCMFIESTSGFDSSMMNVRLSSLVYAHCPPSINLRSYSLLRPANFVTHRISSESQPPVPWLLDMC